MLFLLNWVTMLEYRFYEYFEYLPVRAFRALGQNYNTHNSLLSRSPTSTGSRKETVAQAFQCGERQRRSSKINFASLNVEFLAA